MLVAVSALPAVRAQIAFDPSNSGWAGTASFVTVGSGDSVLHVAVDQFSEPNGALLSVTSGTTFGAVLQGTSGPLQPGQLQVFSELASTPLAAGTPVQLSFTGLIGSPSYVVVFGGGVSQYSYSGGTLTLTATTGHLAQTESNSGGGAFQQGFAVFIETDPNFNFGGTLFRTDAYWTDFGKMIAGFPGAQPTVGLSIAGIQGNPVNFDVYMTLAYLASIGLESTADARAWVQKYGTSFELPLTTSLYTPSGDYNEALLGVAFDNFGGVSTYDLNGGGADELIRASFSNNSWSVGNVGIIAVPEPSTYGLAFGGLALGLAAWRRRRKA